MASLAEMIRRARRQAPGSSTGVRYFDQDPLSSPGVEDITDEMEPPEGVMSDEAIEMQAEDRGREGVLRSQLTELATAAYGHPPEFQGNTMILGGGQGGTVDLGDPDEVVQFMDFASEAMPDPERPMVDIGGGVQTNAPGQVRDVTPRRIQAPPMAVQGRGPGEQAQDEMVFRSLAKTKARLRQRRPQRIQDIGLAGVDMDEVLEGGSERKALKKSTNDIYGRYDALVKKLGMDPQTMKVPESADFSTLTRPERWLARQLGVYRTTAKRRQRQ